MIKTKLSEFPLPIFNGGGDLIDEIDAVVDALVDGSHGSDVSGGGHGSSGLQYQL
jgi:hypothetical protein